MNKNDYHLDLSVNKKTSLTSLSKRSMFTTIQRPDKHLMKRKYKYESFLLRIIVYRPSYVKSLNRLIHDRFGKNRPDNQKTVNHGNATPLYPCLYEALWMRDSTRKLEREGNLVPCLTAVSSWTGIDRNPHRVSVEGKGVIMSEIQEEER